MFGCTATHAIIRRPPLACNDPYGALSVRQGFVRHITSGLTNCSCEVGRLEPESPTTSHSPTIWRSQYGMTLTLIA